MKRARTIHRRTLRFSHHVAVASLCSLIIGLTALSGAAVAQNPVPLINQPLVPDAIRPGGAGFTLTVNGSGFVSGSVVKWNDSARATAFVNQSQLKATILSPDVAKLGTASVTVVNPSPGGGASNVAFFQVTIASSATVLTTSVLRAGVSPAAVAVGDFNGDGKLDMAVPNNASASVSILLGKGHEMFKPAVDYGLGFGSHHPNSAAVGDFNGDGKLDLVVANGGSNDVSVFLGNGDGTFGTALQYITNSDLDSVEPSSVTVGDFNRDGNLDLAVANPGGLSVLLGNGDGTFQPFVVYAAGSTPFWVAEGDLNRDGKLDLVVANEGSNDISVLLGKGDGTFEPAVNYATGSQPASIAVGDFNADGKLDLAVTNLGSNSVSVLLGKGDGTFRTAVDYGAGSAPRWVTVGDLNGDGTLDLVVANSAVSGGTPSASVLFGNGNGTFKSDVEYAVGTEPASVALGDFDGDGRLDMTVADMGISSSQVFVLSATAIFANQLVGTTSPAHPVTLSNYGTQTLEISSIVASPRVFTQTNNCGSSVPPGGYCTIDVTFAPTDRGPRTGTVSIRDDAPDSPQKVYLAGAGTVVTLDPPSLSFACMLSNCPPPPQPTTLTNKGSDTLTVSKITIAGQYFSETNNCPPTLKPNKSCSITVDFNPQKSFGAFSGAVSVFDNGGGSPQQVVLLGTRNKRGMSPAARSALSMTQTAAVPSPTGPNPVGTNVMHLVDSTRDDPFLSNGTKRELLVRFWYPASLTEGCELADYTAPAVWSYFSLLAKSPLPEVRTNSCLDAPIAGGAHPVVVFTHGYTGTFTDYTFIFEDLASRGYVVTSVDHTYEATAVEFPDGRLVKSVLGSHFDESTWRRDETALSSAVSVRLSDLKFIVNELERLNGEVGNPFAGKLDMARVAVAGHSLGGLTALLGVEQEKRFHAGIMIDGELLDSSLQSTNTAVLILAMGRDKWSDNECRLWSDLRGPRFAVNLKGAEHLTPSDAVWLAESAIKTGPMGPEKTIMALRDYIAAFLDNNLRGKPSDLLLRGPSSDYPDAAATTQKQLLCGEGIDH